MESNLPVIVDNKGMTINSKRNFARIKESLKRIGKIGAKSIGAIGVLGVSSIIGGPVVTIIGMGVFTITFGS